MKVIYEEIGVFNGAKAAKALLELSEKVKTGSKDGDNFISDKPLKSRASFNKNSKNKNR